MGTLAISMGLSSIVAANTLENNNLHQHSEPQRLEHQHQHQHRHSNEEHHHEHFNPAQHNCHPPLPPFFKTVPQEQRSAFKSFMQASRQQMLPLMKEKHALKMQLRGLLATPGVQWSDISRVVDKINTNHAQTTTLFAKQQLDLVRRFGVLLPPPPPYTSLPAFAGW